MHIKRKQFKFKHNNKNYKSKSIKMINDTITLIHRPFQAEVAKIWPHIQRLNGPTLYFKSDFTLFSVSGRGNSFYSHFNLQGFINWPFITRQNKMFCALIFWNFFPVENFKCKNENGVSTELSTKNVVSGYRVKQHFQTLWVRKLVDRSKHAAFSDTKCLEKWVKPGSWGNFFST
jgi:hypothetical protein